MHLENIQNLLNDERFKSVLWHKQRVPLFFSIAIIVLFFGFVLIIAFAPGLLSLKLTDAISLYVFISVALIILVCILMNSFVAIKIIDKHKDIYELIIELRRDNLK